MTTTSWDATSTYTNASSHPYYPTNLGKSDHQTVLDHRHNSSTVSSPVHISFAPNAFPPPSFPLKLANSSKFTTEQDLTSNYLSTKQPSYDHHPVLSNAYSINHPLTTIPHPPQILSLPHKQPPNRHSQTTSPFHHFHPIHHTFYNHHTSIFAFSPRLDSFF